MRLPVFLIAGIGLTMLGGCSSPQAMAGAAAQPAQSAPPQPQDSPPGPGPEPAIVTPKAY